MKKKTQDPRIAKKVLEMVADHFKTTPDMLQSKDGDKVARQVVMFILKDGLGVTLQATLDAVDLKGAMSVYTASKAIKALLKTDTELAAKVEEIKAEVLMIISSPESASPGHVAPSAPATKPVAPKNQPSVPPTDPAKNAQLINKIREAVSSVFLGANLLLSENPALEVLLAKDAIVFLAWEHLLGTTSLGGIQDTLQIDENTLYYSIGRITAQMENRTGLKDKIKAARKTYEQS